MFALVSRHFVAGCDPLRNRVSGCIQGMRLCHRNHFFLFRNEHAQSTTLGPKLMFGVVSRHFVAARIAKTGIGCIQGLSLCHRNYFFFFCNEHAQSTTLGPKLMFAVVSRHFVAARDPLRKRVRASILGTGLFHKNHFFFFRLPGQAPAEVQKR